MRSVAFSPDGARIVTASQDRTARVWDAATGKEIAVLRGHEDSVYSAAFSPDGARVVTASVDRTARVWDAATGKEIAVLRGHKDLVYSAAFSPDGARIVTASGGRDRAAVGRRDRQGDRGAARPRGMCGVRRVQPRRRPHRHRVSATGPRGCGTPRPARGSRCCAATSRLCDPSRSAPTAPASSPRHLTGPRGCGTPRPARRSRCCAGTRTG